MRKHWIQVLSMALVLLLVTGGISIAEEKQERMPISITVLLGHTQTDSWIEQQLEEKYNVDITLIPLPGWTDGQAKLNLLMADEDQRPDVIWWWGMDKEYLQWVDAGLLHELTPYMEKYPNITGYYNDTTMFYASHSDGKMYRIPGDVAEPSCMTGWIRKDWLDALDLPVPTTREEFKDTLLKFTFDDPDKNGKDDTYGFSGAGLDMRGFQSFWSPYNVDPNNFVVLPDGNVVHGSTEPAVKQALADIADLYKQGVIDPAIVTRTNDPYEYFINGGHGAFYAWVDWLNPGGHTVRAFRAKNPTAEIIPIEPIKGPDGLSSDETENPGAWCYFAITKKAKDPERIYAMFDDLLNRETYLFRRWGVEGTHYEIVDGVFSPLVSNEENLAENIGLFYLDFFLNRKDDANIANTPETIELFEKRAITSEPLRQKRVYFKSLERPVWHAYGPDIDKLRNEVFYGIITGERPIDDFDDYLKQYKELNGDEVNAEATRLYKEQQVEFEAFKQSFNK